MLDEVKSVILSHKELYKTIFRDGLVIWKPITKRDFDLIGALLNDAVVDSIEQEDYVWNKYVVFSTYTEETLRAGIVSAVAFQIIYYTGFSAPEDVVLANLNRARERRQYDPFEQALLIIWKAFPSYKLEDLENISLRELMRLVALAEELTGLVYVYGSQESVDKQMEALKSAGRTNVEGRTIKSRGGVDTTVYDRAVRQVAPNRTGMNADVINQIPLIRKVDLYPEKGYVETERDNKRMIADHMPFTEQYRREVLGQYW